MMRQRDYLRGKAKKAGSKYLRQGFKHLCNKVDYTLRKWRPDQLLHKKIEDNKDNLRNM